MRQRESGISSAAREWRLGGVTDALLVSLRRGFLLPARRLCNHRHGQKWGAQHSNPIGVRPLLLRAIRPRGSHHVRAGMPEANRRVRPAWLKSSPCLGCNQPPRLSGMNACPQTVPSGDGSRQFTTSFASNVRRCADILVIGSARLFIHGQRLSRSVSTSAFDARGVLLTCCELDFGSVQSSELLQAGWLA